MKFWSGLLGASGKIPLYIGKRIRYIAREEAVTAAVCY